MVKKKNLVKIIRTEIALISFQRHTIGCPKSDYIFSDISWFAYIRTKLYAEQKYQRNQTKLKEMNNRNNNKRGLNGEILAPARPLGIAESDEEHFVR